MICPAFVDGLSRYGDRPAVIGPGDEVLTYRDLDERVSARTGELGPGRRLVLVVTSPGVDSLVTYLATLRAGHVALLTGDDRSADRLAAEYHPDTVVRPGAAGGPAGIDVAGPPRHRLHPDLTLLLSTSGSTGSPKLVRLSARNLDSNAEAIARYLPIRPDDRAPMMLPLHYCYGLSVVNSNLRRGAALLPVETSVSEPEFWTTLREREGTSLHGVPYTFELLDAVGFAGFELPSLRYLTQAGGRWAPDDVRRYAELGTARGWSLYVMYGQTEATARMAYLPPDQAATAPSAVGVAIPGSRLTVRDAGADGVGDLVFQGPGVMLGYARRPADLALGRTVDELVTGDRARVRPDGLVEITGRAGRFVKPFGLRIDLDDVERRLAGAGVRAACAGDDAGLVVVAETGPPSDRVRRLLAETLPLPASAVQVVRVDRLPRTPAGKIDGAAVAELARQVDGDRGAGAAGDRAYGERAGGDRAVGAGSGPEVAAPPADARPSGAGTVRVARRRPAQPATAGPDAVRAAFRAAFPGRGIADDDSFAGLGGDSLSYVQMVLHLQRALGTLPAGWPTMTVAALARLAPQPRWWVMVETPVLLRAVAIVLVVAGHVGAFRLLGGAHVLLAVAGWAFARFVLVPRATGSTSGVVLGTVAKIAIPSALWVAMRATTEADVDLHNALLLNYLLDPHAWGYWFVESLAQILLLLAVLFAVPAVRAAERARPFAFAACATAVSLAGLLVADAAHPFSQRLMSPHQVLWIFLLGWLAQRADNPARRLLVVAVTLALVPSFFGGETVRGVVVTVGLLLLVVPALPVPRRLVGPMAAVAAASLVIYLTHYAIYPALAGLPALLATALCVACGVGLHFGLRALRHRTAVGRAGRAAATRMSRRARPATVGAAGSGQLG